MVTFPKPMVHRDCHIANGIPASRVLDLDNQSRFGVTSAFLRANSPAGGLHPSSAAQKESRNTGHTAQKRRRSLHQTNLHAAKPSLYLVTLAYTKSRLSRQALVPYVSDVASVKLLRGLDSSNHPAHVPPVRLLDQFYFCADACIPGHSG